MMLFQGKYFGGTRLTIYQDQLGLVGQILTA